MRHGTRLVAILQFLNFAPNNDNNVKPSARQKAPSAEGLFLYAAAAELKWKINKKLQNKGRPPPAAALF